MPNIDWSLVVKILEALSYVSSIILVPLAFYGLKQISVTKNNTIKESKRDSLRVASSQIECFFKDILPKSNHQILSKEDKEILKSFTLNDELGIDYDQSFKKLTKENLKLTKEKYLRSIFELFDKNLHIINTIEAFSSSFTSGLGDENTAYKALGKTFTNIIDDYINLIRYFNNDGYYKNVIIIYELWKQRLTKEEVTRDSKKLRAQLNDSIDKLDSIEKNINKIEDKSIKSIGVDN